MQLCVLCWLLLSTLFGQGFFLKSILEHLWVRSRSIENHVELWEGLRRFVPAAKQSASAASTNHRRWKIWWRPS